MRRAEIERKFDEMVVFAEIEKFLDTQVKHYSSGMYMRLAFAVAAHLEPEILLVDEVLAVGDAEFQRKSLGKMGEVAHSGRTVLFVSHQMNAIRTLCSQSVLLSQGKVQMFGATNDVVSMYLSSNEINEVSEWRVGTDANKNDNPYFSPTKVCVVDKDWSPIKGIATASQKIGVVIEGEIEKLHQALTIGFAVYTSVGDLFAATTAPSSDSVTMKARSSTTSRADSHR